MKSKVDIFKVGGPGLLIAALVLILAACVAPMDQPPAAPVAPTAQPAEESAPAAGGGQLTDEQLKNATYSGIYDQPVTLTDGKYEGAPFAEGGASRPTVTFIDGITQHGDLNGDGVDDAAVLLVESSGGSGVFDYVGAQINENGQPVDAGTVMLGDRSQIISGAIVDGQVVIEMVTQGPNDAMCCATLKVRKSFVVQDGKLAETGTEELGNVALDDLMGTSWVLEELNRDKPVLEETAITAAFADGVVSGSAGCNNYNASVSSDGGQNLTVGPAATTMMACPDPVSSQEMAYLTALQGTTQWSYYIGKLAISYQDADGNLGALIFAPDAQSSEASGTESGDGSASSEEIINATFKCENDATIEAAFDNTNRTVTLTMPDQSTLTLPQVEAASGAKYSDGTTTFWNSGNEAIVEVNGEMVYQACSTAS